jgi:hypothetical protein
MRLFYEGWEICQTVSGNLEARVICPTVSGKSDLGTKLQAPSAKSSVGNISPTPSTVFEVSTLVAAFPLSWSHYVRLMSVDKSHARVFYESEAIRGGWSVRQLDRQSAC